MSSQSVAVSLFENFCKPDVVSVRKGDWSVFVDGLRKPLPKDIAKEDLPLWSLAEFRDGYRHADNVHAISALTLDVDEAPIPSAERLLQELSGFSAVCYSSSNATASAPRWRAAIALSRPVTAEEYPKLSASFTAALSFPVGSASKDPSRQWYVPRVGVDGFYELFEVPGEPLDVDALLAMQPEEAPKGPIVSKVRETSTTARRSAAAAMIASAWPPKGSRLDARLALSGATHYAGMSEAEAVQFMEDVHARVADRGDVTTGKLATLASETFRKAERGDRVAGFPALSRYVDAGVVNAARDLLNEGVQLMAEIARELNATSSQAANDTATALLPSFPVQALPPVLRNFVVATAEYTQTPVDMAAMLSLGVCSAAIAGKMDIDVGWVEPLNLFAVMSAPPAERKSPVFKECLRPLRQCERDAIEKASSTIATAQTDRDLLVSQIKKKKDELLKLSPFEVTQEYQVNKCGPASGGIAIREELGTLESRLLKTVVPAAPRFLADDVTMEKLASLMAEQGGRMCVASAEGTLFGIIAGRYSRNGQGSFEVLLKGHAGEPLTVDRQSKDCPAVHMESACLTLVLAVQPSIIKGLSADSNMKGQGLLARFLYSLPTSRVGSRSIAAARIPKTASDGYRDVVRSLAAVPTLAERIAMGDGSRDINAQFAANEAREGIAPALTLSAEALAMFQELRLETEKRLIGDLADMADWAGKWCGAVGRIAGILHCAEFGPAGDVSGATMRSAIAIGRYLIEHARAAFGLMSTDALEEDSAAVIAWATRTKRTQFTMRELSRLGPREVVRDKKRRVAVVEALYDLGRVELNGTTFTLT